ncbi:hypothetical protein EJD97_010475, partial [Solanum chilense]
MSKFGWVDGPGDGSSWSRRDVMDSVVPHFANYSSSLFITLDGRYDGSSQEQRSVEGLRSITLELLEFGYWDYFSDLHDELAGQTSWLRWSVTHSVTPHLVRLPHIPSAVSLRGHLRTVTGMADCHR